MLLPPRALYLGSYPPRECGIATFTKDVVTAYDRTLGAGSQIIAIDEPGGDVRRYGPEVIARIREQDRYSYRPTSSAPTPRSQAWSSAA